MRFTFELYAVHRVEGEIECNSLIDAQEILAEFSPIPDPKVSNLETAQCMWADIEIKSITADSHVGDPGIENDFSGITIKELVGAIHE